MATRDSIPVQPHTGAYHGRCWVMPPADPGKAVDQINHTMQRRVVDHGLGGLYLRETGLNLQDRQIVVILTHGGQASLFVCDSMEVNQ